MEDIVYALIPIVAILAFAAVAILRPLSKKLGVLLETVQRDRSARLAGDERQEQVRAVVGALEQRIELLEQRLEFTETLLEGRRGAPSGGRLDSASRERVAVGPAAEGDAAP